MRQIFIAVATIILAACGGGGSSSGGGGGNPVAGQFDKFQISPSAHNLRYSVYAAEAGTQERLITNGRVAKKRSVTISLPPPSRIVPWYHVYVKADSASHGEKIPIRVCHGKNMFTKTRSAKGKCRDITVSARESRHSLFTVHQDAH